MNDNSSGKRNQTLTSIIAIILLTVAIILVATSCIKDDASLIQNDEETAKFKGIILTYSPKDGASVTEKDMEVYSELIVSRLRGKGYTDAIVINRGKSLLVEIPDIREFPQAESLAQRPVTEITDASGNVLVNASHIKDANTELGKLTEDSKGYKVTISFTGEGSLKFGQATGEISTREADNRIYINLDNITVASPEVYGAIENGECSIEGNFSESEAKFLATMIRASAIPFEMELTDNKTN